MHKAIGKSVSRRQLFRALQSWCPSRLRTGQVFLVLIYNRIEIALFEYNGGNMCVKQCKNSKMQLFNRSSTYGIRVGMQTLGHTPGLYVVSVLCASDGLRYDCVTTSLDVVRRSDSFIQPFLVVRRITVEDLTSSVMWYYIWENY